MPASVKPQLIGYVQTLTAASRLVYLGQLFKYLHLFKLCLVDSLKLFDAMQLAFSPPVVQQAGLVHYSRRQEGRLVA